MNDEVRFIDLFSGIGGFRKGLEDCGGSESYREDSRSKRAFINGIRRENEHGSPYSHEIGLERANNYSSEQPSTQSRRWHKNTEKISDEARSRSSSRSRGKPKKFRHVWSCDNNKYANQIYTKQFGEANHYSGDVRGVDPGDIPDFDLLCAGFPCQSFSVAGKGKGFQDTRGTLFFEISRIAEAKRPQMLLLENVKGLLSNDRGQTFQTILQELGRIGYWAEWQVLNSKHHGVPQNRERVFIIGHLRNGRSRPIFPIGQTDEMAKKDGRGRSPVQPEVSTAIDGSYYKGVDRHGQKTVILDTFNRGGVKEGEAYSLKTNPSPTSSAVVAVRPKDDWFSQHAIYPSEGIGPTLRGNQNDPSPRIVMPILTPDRAEKMQHGRRFKEPGDPSFTLTGQDIHGVAISFTNPHDSEEERKVNLSDTSRGVKPPYGNQQPFVAIGSDKPTVRSGGKGSLERHAWDTLTDGFRIRRLTPVECERLQGFPDFWTAQGICKKGDIVWTGKYKIRVETDEDGLEVTRYRPIMTKAKADGIYSISDTQRYRALGNAVTTRVITFLGRRIMKARALQ